MLERIIQAAEQSAVNVSRRQFFDRFGRAALAAAAAVAGVLSGPDIAQARAAICGPLSAKVCQGRPQGSRCPLGRGGGGYCRQAPVCYCGR